MKFGGKKCSGKPTAGRKGLDRCWYFRVTLIPETSYRKTNNPIVEIGNCRHRSVRGGDRCLCARRSEWGAQAFEAERGVVSRPPGVSGGFRQGAQFPVFENWKKDRRVDDGAVCQAIKEQDLMRVFGTVPAERPR